MYLWHDNNHFPISCKMDKRSVYVTREFYLPDTTFSIRVYIATLLIEKVVLSSKDISKKLFIF